MGGEWSPCDRTIAASGAVLATEYAKDAVNDSKVSMLSSSSSSYRIYPVSDTRTSTVSPIPSFCHQSCYLETKRFQLRTISIRNRISFVGSEFDCGLGCNAKKTPNLVESTHLHHLCKFNHVTHPSLPLTGSLKEGKVSVIDIHYFKFFLK